MLLNVDIAPNETTDGVLWDVLPDSFKGISELCLMDQNKMSQRQRCFTGLGQVILRAIQCISFFILQVLTFFAIVSLSNPSADPEGQIVKEKHLLHSGSICITCSLHSNLSCLMMTFNRRKSFKKRSVVYHIT